MLDLSLVEILLIGVVALIVVGPQDLPKVIKQIIKFLKSMQGFTQDIKQSVTDLADESGINEIKKDVNDDMKYIIDQNGEFQEIYDINDFLEEDDRPKLSPTNQTNDNDPS